MPRNIRAWDLFAAVNSAIFVGIAVAWALSGPRRHFGHANLTEFLGYSAIIAGLAVVGRRQMRDARGVGPVLLFTQIGILIHFAGGLVVVDGRRLYELTVLGLPFDKWVHLYNGLAGGALSNRLIGRHIAPAPQGVVVFLVLMGAGAIVELVEYGAWKLIPENGVGGYDNNMLDMVANGVGCLAFLALRAVFAALRSRPAPEVSL